jgi:NAD+ kinase
MKIAFVASPKPGPQQAFDELTARYGQVAPEKADYIVAIGGDGTVLKALHAGMLTTPKPVFALRTVGSVGFLGNSYRVHGLPDRLLAASQITLHPLRAEIERTGAQARTLFGINDIVLVRERLQSAKLRLSVDDQREPSIIVGDGILVTTPIGSSAYNRALGGARLALGSELLGLTGIALDHASSWCNTIVHDRAVLSIEVIDPDYRPIRAENSLETISAAVRVRITSEINIVLALLVENSDEIRTGGSPAPQLAPQGFGDQTGEVAQLGLSRHPRSVFRNASD